MDNTVLKKYLNTKKLTGKKSSVHFGNETRFHKAEEQLNVPVVSREKIIYYTNEVLVSLGMESIQNPYYDMTKPINYAIIKSKYHLSCKKDIIWMKFTKNGHLGVVAVSSDINFQIPTTTNCYNERKTRRKWRYNTSGIIVHYLGEEWDTDYVLLFPLKTIPSGYKRGMIEKVIGEYLLSKNVPILDYYSHRF